MAGNTNLHKASAAKNDEFYTQLTDIEKELKHYKHHFEGKTVFCNCDDPEHSNFWQYFSLNFKELKLKKLIATHFDREKPSYKLVMWKDDRGVHSDIKTLRQNGDFRSEESIELLKEADIVVTNPPFSLFREYIAQLMEYDKKFLIIGNKNAINYLCPDIKYGKLWIGYNSPNEFKLPDGSTTKKVTGLTRWFTNLDIHKRHEDIPLWKKYYDDPSQYPKYDNYDAINVDKVADIPCDYDSAMGVPITFLDNYNSEQFEIIGITYSKDKNPDIEKIRTDDKKRHVGILNGKEKYPRVIIQKKEKPNKNENRT
ncbi:MAG: hypothetical protein IKU20_02125 [Lachnospiraceae bacterium]|nr:hypothetical protein [Lachnospiraceae bacterium]